MIKWNQLNIEERQAILDEFDAGINTFEAFTEEPRIILSNGTVLFIEGVLD